MMIIFLIITFLTISFIGIMLGIQEYENKNQKGKIIRVYSSFFNFAFILITMLLLIRVFPFVIIDRTLLRFILEPSFFITSLVYFLDFIILNIFFQKRSNLSIKKYLLLNTAIILVSILILCTLIELGKKQVIDFLFCC